ncbi:hypothetical protein, partial [Pseudomonas viridiflava]|uniref:hypothetical protein n=1 Tax=Pseudomonas viridiflava TaxID=33069 RepID=UPI0013DF3AF3
QSTALAALSRLLAPMHHQRFDFLDHCPFLSKSEPNTQITQANTDPTQSKTFKNNALKRSVLGVLGLSGLLVLAWEKIEWGLNDLNNVTHARTRR